MLLTADELTLSVGEYRPVYVNGEPGQQTFRPGLTVPRPGGYDVMRFRTKDPFLEAAELRELNRPICAWLPWSNAPAHMM